MPENKHADQMKAALRPLRSDDGRPSVVDPAASHYQSLVDCLDMIALQGNQAAVAEAVENAKHAAGCIMTLIPAEYRHAVSIIRKLDKIRVCIEISSDSKSAAEGALATVNEEYFGVTGVDKHAVMDWVASAVRMSGAKDGAVKSIASSFGSMLHNMLNVVELHVAGGDSHSPRIDEEIRLVRSYADGMLKDIEAWCKEPNSELDIVTDLIKEARNAGAGNPHRGGGAEKIAELVLKIKESM